MAPTVDVSGIHFLNGTTNTVSLNIGSNADRALYVFLSDPAATGVTSVKWNTSETATQIASGTWDGATRNWFLYRLLNPTAANTDVDVVWPSSGQHTAVAVAVYDVDQSTPNDSADESEGSGTAAQNTVSGASGDLGLCFVAAAGSTTLAPASGETELVAEAGSCTGYSLAGAASMSFDVTLGTSRDWVTVGINVNVAAGVTEVDLAGAQPASTGALALTYLIGTAGSEPAASGVVTALQTLFRSLTGNLPAQTGDAAVQYLISVAGAQPAMSGLLEFIYSIAVAGNEPAKSGALGPVVYYISLAGNEPAKAGAQSDLQYIALAGNQAAMSGAVSTLYQIALTGDEPAKSGAMSLLYLIAVAGNEPAKSGALSALLSYSLAGNQPSMSGILTFTLPPTGHGNVGIRQSAQGLHVGKRDEPLPGIREPGIPGKLSTDRFPGRRHDGL